MKALFLMGLLVISEVLAEEGDFRLSSPPRLPPRSHQGRAVSRALGPSNDFVFPADPDRLIFEGQWTRRTTEQQRIISPTADTTELIYNSEEDTVSTTAKPKDPALEACKRACLVTPEYNPVCGTDNVTYGNIGLLECARTCGVDIQLKRKSPCGKVNNSRKRRDFSYAIENCVMGCASETSGYNPVCGSDYVTYANLGRLQCAQRCGLPVTILKHSSCSTTFNWDDGVEICISTCKETSEYSPVCGSDNRTYKNEGMFQCAKNCGRNMQIIRRTSCSVPDTTNPWGPTIPSSTKPINPWEPTTPSSFNPWGPTIPSSTKPINPWGPTTPSSFNPWGPTIPSSTKPINPWGPTTPSSFNPWGIYTPSPNVPIDPWGLNNPSSGKPLGPSGITTSSSNGNGGASNGGGLNGGGSGSKTPSVAEIIACKQLCQSTPEVNPVCGTDGVTYSNAGQLLCAQSCGVDVKVYMFAPCPGFLFPSSTPTSTPTPTPTPTTTPTPTLTPTPTSTLKSFLAPTLTPTAVPKPPSIQDCINKCLVSIEFRPVCGTDGVMYINIESLRCKINCEGAASVLNEAPCGFPTLPTVSPSQPMVTTAAPTTARPSDLETCINTCTQSQPVNGPVCGTDGITYPNLAAFQCAKQCGINIDIKSQSTCANGGKDEITTSPVVSFTIPSPLLISIFSQPSSITPTTTPVDDSLQQSSDELDRRFGSYKA